MTTTDKVHFLNGYIGQRLTEEWLRSENYEVQREVKQIRGTEKAVSSGDIDIIARKGSEIQHVEVKFWERYPLTPSWLVQFMLDRKKLNTLFEKCEGVNGYILVYRFPGTGIFVYQDGLKYLKELHDKYSIPEEFLRRLTNKPVTDFVQEVLTYLVRRKTESKAQLRIVYFDEILRGLKRLNSLEIIRAKLEAELLRYFHQTYSDVTSE